jgi:hypothetical protein
VTQPRRSWFGPGSVGPKRGGALAEEHLEGGACGVVAAQVGGNARGGPGRGGQQHHLQPVAHSRGQVLSPTACNSSRVDS